MKIRAVLSAFALVLIFSLSSHALETKCVVVGPAASQLSAIAREAAAARTQAEAIESYLRTNGSPDWRLVAYEMDYLKENVLTLQKTVARFESREPKLTEAQSQRLERLKAGLATLTVFVNNTYHLIRDQQIFPHRNDLLANAKAMGVRAEIIRDAARSLRTGESA